MMECLLHPNAADFTNASIINIDNQSMSAVSPAPADRTLTPLGNLNESAN